MRKLVHVPFPMLAAFVVVLMSAFPGTAAAQAGQEPLPVDLPDLRQAIESSQTLTDADREAGLAALSAAEVATQEASDLLSRAESYRAQAEAAPAALEAVRAELEDAADPIDPEPSPSATLADLEQRLAQVSADLRAARESLRTLEQEAETRRERRGQIPDELAAAMQRQETLAEDAGGVGNGLVDSARTAASDARLAKARAEVEFLQAELLSYDARQELLPARRDRALRRVARLEQLEQRWQEIVQSARQNQARQEARDAEQLRRQAAQQSPVLSRFAEVNEALARSRASADGLPQRLARTERDLARARQQLADLQSQYSTVSRRLSASGLSRATGIVLRRQYDALPELAILRQRLADTRERLEEAEIRLVDWQELRLGAGDIEGTIAALQRSARDASPDLDVESAEFEAVARQLATARRDLLNQLIADSTESYDKLLALEELRATLLDATRRYREFIGERILWVRSISDDRSDAAAASADIAPDALAIDAAETDIDPRASLDQAVTALRSNIAWSVLVLIAVVATGLAVVWNRRTSSQLAQKVKSYRSDRLGLTYLSLAAALAVAAPAAFAWWLLSRIFTDGAGESIAVASLGWGFRHTLSLVAGLIFATAVFAKNGLAEAHFRWPRPAVTAARRHLRWFAPTFAVLVLIAVSIDHTRDMSLNTVAGRVAFLASQIVVAVFGWLILRPRGPVLREYIAKRKNSAAHRLLVVARVAAIVAPLALAAMSWAGYHYTALELSRRLGLTIGLILLLVLANAMLMRWLFIARRRVAIEDAKRRREQALAEAEEDQAEEDGPTESSLPPIDEEKLDLPAISGQTTQLFRACVAVTLALGLLGIWSSVLPALRALDQVQIWPSVQITEAATDPGIESLDVELLTGRPEESADIGEAEPATSSTSSSFDPTGLSLATGSAGETTAVSDAPTVVTLADIGLALVIGFIAIVAFRNVPGLAEIFVLQRLPLDAASRFALATVLRYAIGFAGVLATAAVIGISWDKVQWLAAALTFGLAFGLQEIFANFVSGLIILAERPVRIGDTVTVGNVSGTVTKIRMRATTVTDWDRKELVIPNRQFITDQVINWTLSDPILRVIVPVGVAYGSNIELVEKSLMEIGERNSIVLDTPKHYVLFRDFADSTLNFELRVFIPHIEHLLTVQHQLRVEIDRVFRERDIEIAFPQRDLHLRSADPIVEIAEHVRGRADDGARS